MHDAYRLDEWARTDQPDMLSDFRVAHQEALDRPRLTQIHRLLQDALAGAVRLERRGSRRDAGAVERTGPARCRGAQGLKMPEGGNGRRWISWRRSESIPNWCDAVERAARERSWSRPASTGTGAGGPVVLDPGTRRRNARAVHQGEGSAQQDQPRHGCPPQIARVDKGDKDALDGGFRPACQCRNWPLPE